MSVLKVGYMVECCDLMPGIIMKIDGDTVGIRKLHLDNDCFEKPDDLSYCSKRSCGLVPITAQQALFRLRLGKDKLESIWKTSETSKDYYSKLNEAFLELNRNLSNIG